MNSLLVFKIKFYNLRRSALSPGQAPKFFRVITPDLNMELSQANLEELASHHQNISMRFFSFKLGPAVDFIA